jgi:PBP1b-binding outer membrane lipoprotein LpoB
MKMSHKFLMLVLLTLVLSGCATGPCKKNAAETAAPEKTEAVATPVVPEVVQETAPAAPVTPEEPAEEKIPAAVLK